MIWAFSHFIFRTAQRKSSVSPASGGLSLGLRNQGHVPPGCFLRLHCPHCPHVWGGRQSGRAGGKGREVEREACLMPSFVLAGLCQPPPGCRPWRGSSVYFVEVRHPSLNFSLMRISEERIIETKVLLTSLSIFDPGEQALQPKFLNVWSVLSVFCFLNFFLSRWVCYLKTPTRVVVQDSWSSHYPIGFPFSK